MLSLHRRVSNSSRAAPHRPDQATPSCKECRRVRIGLCRAGNANSVQTAQEVLAASGMAPYQVERVSRELERLPDTSKHSGEWVQSRLELLRAVLGQSVSPPLLAEALYNGGMELLQQDMTLFPAQLEKLKEALGGVQDVVGIVAKEPRLLWAAAIDQVVPKVLAKLVQVYPYKSSNRKADVIKLVQEYPELLVRMQYYCDDPKVKKVQDLPVDLQNRILRSYC